MQTTKFQLLKKLTIFIIIAILLITILTKLITTTYAHKRVFSVNDVDPKVIAIVFGAGLWKDGSPTPVLRDRVKTASDLYFAGKVDKILMSGDNRYQDYNEPQAMRTYAKDLGVPEKDIVLDYAGRRTYDTCVRAGKIFGLQDAILVTQRFHLARAIYTCNTLGINAVGVPADQRIYRRSSLMYWKIREIIATAVAMWDIHISQPLPILGEPEPIFKSQQNINDPS
jgi:vancomycin permeability regulator SanA